MHMDEQKKILLITGMEQNHEKIMRQLNISNPQNAVILQHHHKVISQPFDDLMRDIILAVYQEDIEDIYVIYSKEKPVNIEDIWNKFEENEAIQQKLPTLDYLLKYCIPEFPENSVREWLEGKQNLTNIVEENAKAIKNHPLVPNNMKIHELYINQNSNQSKVTISDHILT